MRTKSRSAAVTLVLVTALAATGCTPEAPRANEKPTPTSTPLFASDEEALAAAEEAYAAYVQLTDEILSSGGLGVERLSEVSTGRQLQTDSEEIRELAALGYRTIGATHFSDMSLQEFVRDRPSGEAVVSVYVCEDVSGVDVVDANGVSVVEESRPDRVRYQVAFDSEAPRSGLLVSIREPWSEPQC
jgi:hypothetical protein